MLILVNNCSSLHESDENPRKPVITVSEMRVRPGPTPLNQMSVTMRAERDELPTLQLSGYSTYISTDHERYGANEVRMDVDVESGPER
jgi:hypothetical protein